jgi:membrane protein DedA with SNARE-associated domain
MSAAQIVAACGAVLFLCLAVWRLRTGRLARAALGGTVALLLALYAGGAGVGLPDGDRAVANAAETLGAWTYPFVALMAFLETSIPPVTVVFPGEWAVMLGGAIAGYGEVAIVPLVLIAWVCSALGDSVTFALGRHLGRPFLQRRGPSFGLTQERLEWVDRWLDRYGAAAVCLGRLLPLARPFAPFIAGSSRFPYRRFLVWNVVGTLLFALVFCLLGYAFYRSYDELAGTVGRVALGALVVVIAAVLAVRSLRRRRAARAPALALDERAP